MRVFHRFTTQHSDLIHDLSYDYYGNRIATCSSDQSIKVWDLVDGEWQMSASWKVCLCARQLPFVGTALTQMLLFRHIPVRFGRSAGHIQSLDRCVLLRAAVVGARGDEWRLVTHR